MRSSRRKREPIGSFEKRNFYRRIDFLNTMRRGKTSNTTANHDNPVHPEILSN